MVNMKTLTLKTLKELCEDNGVDEDAEIEIGYGGKVHKANRFWYVSGAIILDDRKESEAFIVEGKYPLT